MRSRSKRSVFRSSRWARSFGSGSTSSTLEHVARRLPRGDRSHGREDAEQTATVATQEVSRGIVLPLRPSAGDGDSLSKCAASVNLKRRGTDGRSYRCSGCGKSGHNLSFAPVIRAPDGRNGGRSWIGGRLDVVLTCWPTRRLRLAAGSMGPPGRRQMGTETGPLGTPRRSSRKPRR
jgi:hypothetical protein